MCANSLYPQDGIKSTEGQENQLVISAEKIKPTLPQQE